MAYKATVFSYLGSLASVGVFGLFVHEAVGFKDNDAAFLLVLIAAVVIGAIVYGRTLTHPDNGPIGFKNNFLFLSAWTIFSIIIIFIFWGFFGLLLAKLVGTTNQSITSNQKSYSTQSEEGVAYQGQSHQPF